MSIYLYIQVSIKYLKSKSLNVLSRVIIIHIHYRHNTGTDNNPMQIKPTEVVPIYDTPVKREAIELCTNTAYDRPVNQQKIINTHNNTAYGQIIM